MDVDDFARKRILDLEARVAEIERRLGIVHPQLAGASPSVIAHLREGNLIAADSLNRIADHMVAKRLLDKGLSPTAFLNDLKQLLSY